MNGGDGLFIGTECKNIRVVGGHYAQNGNAGIALNGTAEAYITGGLIGAGDGLLGNRIGLFMPTAFPDSAKGLRSVAIQLKSLTRATTFNLEILEVSNQNGIGATSITTDSFGEALIPHGLGGI